MISLLTIIDKIIKPALNATGFNYAIFMDAGKYIDPERQKNTVIRYINTLVETTDYTSQRISSGLLAMAQSVSVSFMLPLDDYPDETGNYPIETKFRDALTKAFGLAPKLSVVTDEGTPDEKTYVGGISFSIPIRGTRAIRSAYGDSIEYHCGIQLSYLENGVNASDVVVTLDGETIPYTRFALRRSPSLSALLPPSVTNGEGKCYSELTSFTVDLDMPILSDSAPSASVLAYAAGNLSMNTKKTLTVTIPGFMDLTEEVIFGECTLNGEGVGNLSCEVRFVPAVEPNLEA